MHSKSTEDKILSTCHLWLWNTYPELRGLSWHIPNERKQSKLQGSILKAKGVVSGVPDYVINFETKVYYIEFKSQTGKQSENQKFIEKQLKRHHIDYYIIKSFDEFKQLVLKILKNHTT